jgi:hypothetical protein
MMYYVSIGGANGMVGLALSMSPAAGREAGKASIQSFGFGTDEVVWAVPGPRETLGVTSCSLS